jgi:hypothetical protein
MRIWGYKNKTIFHGFDQPSLADLPTIYLGYNWMGSRLTTVGIYQGCNEEISSQKYIGYK